MADDRHNPYCLPCIYYGKSTMTCDYIFLENSRRLCPGGEGCIARRTKKDVKRKMSKSKWDTELGMQMWLEGKKDKEIAEHFGIATNTVTTCRRKYWEKHKQPPQRDSKEQTDLPVTAPPPGRTRTQTGEAASQHGNTGRCLFRAGRGN